MPTILIVDDDIDWREILSDLLQAKGFEVLMAYDGQHAWDVLQSHRPDVILSDIEMPHLDGISLCDRIHRTPQMAHIPIILISGNPPLNRPSIVVDMLQKPVQLDTLLSTLNQALREDKY